MIKFLVKGLDAILAETVTVKKNIQEKLFMREVAKVELADIQKRIKSTKRTAQGALWAPWAPSTFRARTKKGNSSKGLLFDSGKLHDSFRIVQGDKTFTIGTNLPYARFLEEGTNRMPARSFMGVSPEARKTIKDILDKSIGIKK